MSNPGLVPRSLRCHRLAEYQPDRDAITWSPAERHGVERLIEKFDVLGSYTFDD